MRTVAIVPCRTGSKGILGKNVRVFHGRPLFAWAVTIGKITCSEAYVSSDDHGLEHLARVYGANFIPRPAELATDEAPMLGVVQHALGVILKRGDVPPDALVLLQPTAPWRTAERVREAISLLEESGADSVASVVRLPATHSPEFVIRLRGDRVLLPPGGITRRQDAQPAYIRDGTVYVTRRSVIENGSLYGRDCRALVIPAKESLNLDTEEDWAQAVARAAH